MKITELNFYINEYNCENKLPNIVMQIEKTKKYIYKLYFGQDG